MPDTQETRSVLTEKLRTIQEKMHDVSEQEVLQALSATVTAGATSTKTLSVERQTRSVSVLTRTA